MSASYTSVENNFRQSLERLCAKSYCAGISEPSVLRVHQSLLEYKPTPLVALPALAESLGLADIRIKDESQRFGLKAFKALGATYAVYRWLESQGFEFNRDLYAKPESLPESHVTFCTATDGNHGFGVAWTARKLQQRAVIYMPGNTVPARIERIRELGAEVVIVAGHYDDAVSRCAVDAAANGWQIISDHSWDDYREIPNWISAGYSTMFREVHELQAPEFTPDIIVSQGGVGALTAAVVWFYRCALKNDRVKIISVEPESAACLFESIQSPDGQPITISAAQDSIMAGLNCGTPSLSAWPLIRDGVDMFMTITDDNCRSAMRQLYEPDNGDPQVILGESGAAGLAGLTRLMCDAEYAPLRQRLELDASCSVLLVNTEGDTDPVSFEEIVSTD